MAISLPAPIAVPAQTADTVWVSNVTIIAPNPAGKVMATATVTPMVSSTGALITAQQKQIRIPDLYATAGTNASVGAAVQAIYAAISNIVAAQNIFSKAQTVFVA
jgi:hypothetical protein